MSSALQSLSSAKIYGLVHVRRHFDFLIRSTPAISLAFLAYVTFSHHL